jgi:Winged helix DNA-binding domain
LSERVLTQRELNRALLARQLLLERVRLPLPRVVDRLAGIQAQYAPSSYIALWTRVEGFRREQLTRALERRSLIQGTLLRGTIHIVSRSEYWAWAEAIREPQREWLQRAWPKLAALDVDRVNGTLCRALREGPRHRDELVELVGKDEFRAADLNVVRVPPSGTWEHRRADLYAAAEDWVGPNDADADAGRELIVRRYLGAFGPARVADIQSWSGIGLQRVKAAVERLELRRFCDEQGRELVDLPRTPLPGPDTPAPPRFIPHWEPLLLVHARRTGVLPEEFRPILFTSKLPASMATFLVDGAVRGSWRIERAGDRATLRLEPFAALPVRARRVVRAEGERLVRWYADDATSYAVRWTLSRG